VLEYKYQLDQSEAKICEGPKCLIYIYKKNNNSICIFVYKNNSGDRHHLHKGEVSNQLLQFFFYTSSCKLLKNNDL